MAFALLSPLPRGVRETIIESMYGRRCWICDEGRGLLCCIDNCEYEMRCVACHVGMLEDMTHPRLEDGIRNGAHSWDACSQSVSPVAHEEPVTGVSEAPFY